MLEGADLDSLTTKKIRKALEQKFGSELRHKKEFIRATLTDLIIKREKVSENEDEEEEEEEEGKEVEKKKRGNAGFGKKMLTLSDKLAGFLGVGQETRPQVVKRMWAYIKENNLQDPNDGRKIILDKPLQDVFNRETLTAFNMNRHLTGHLKKEGEADFPVVLDSDDEEYIRQKEEKKRKRDEVNKKKRAARKKMKKKNPKKPRDPNKPMVLNAFTRPIKISEELQMFLNKDEASRSEVVKKLWEYIKANDLQNPADKREIICDEKLTSLLGEERVTSFSLNKLIQHHYIK